MAGDVGFWWGDELTHEGRHMMNVWQVSFLPPSLPRSRSSLPLSPNSLNRWTAHDERVAGEAPQQRPTPLRVMLGEAPQCDAVEKRISEFDSDDGSDNVSEGV